MLFIPVADIWAFYRIKKLQKSIIYLILPALGLLVVVMVPYMAAYENMVSDPVLAANLWASEETIMVQIILNVEAVALQALEIYLIYRRSKRWNEQFENQ